MKILVLALLCSTAFANDHLRTIYNTLDPYSVSQSLAFYELYPASEEGNEALKRSCDLLKTKSAVDVQKVATFINRTKGRGELTSSDCAIIERMAAHLNNRKLAGYLSTCEDDVLKLDPKEIDLGKALLLSQTGDSDEARKYSALLDLMALQILAKLPQEPTFYDKIKATNQFIFQQMHFRFPPQSIYAEAIDLFTFLPSVMDDHLGVCLGVTALYLALAQRIDLPLDIITPPGHIFVRYDDGQNLINIETTARGIHIESEHYLGINTRKLDKRELKEVIGMTHVNQASVFLHQGKFDQAVAAYKKAWPYMEGDALLSELLGYSLVLTDQDREGRALLEKVKDHIPDHAVQKRVLAEDYLNGKTDKEGIRVVFSQVDETRESILAKQEKLQAVLKKHPHFRDGLLQSAICYVQLSRYKEALEQLLRYHALDPNDPTVEYYLAALHAERHDFKNCWQHVEKAELLTKSRDSDPRVLRDLRLELLSQCPSH